jgi:predicted AAA+ superfamily ATPase
MIKTQEDVKQLIKLIKGCYKIVYYETDSVKQSIAYDIKTNEFVNISESKEIKISSRGIISETLLFNQLWIDRKYVNKYPCNWM